MTAERAPKLVALPTPLEEAIAREQHLLRVLSAVVAMSGGSITVPAETMRRHGPLIEVAEDARGNAELRLPGVRARGAGGSSG